MINIAITVCDGEEVQAVYVRVVDGSLIDTKDMQSVKEYVADFLCSDDDIDFSIEKFSPFGKFCVMHYNSDLVSNEILLTWEHVQS